MKKLDIPNRGKVVKYVEEMAGQMGSSAIVLSIFTDNYRESLDGLLQFVMALMLDKPLFLLVREGTRIPQKVKQVVDGIEYYKEGDQAGMEAASRRLMQRAHEKGFVA